MNRSIATTFPPLAALLLIALCLLCPRPAAALKISKSLPLYAHDMEFYYQHTHPEVLPGILCAFDAHGALAQGEKRLMAAAFLAEALRRDPSARDRLLPPPDTLSRNGRFTLAWMIHLAGLADEKTLLAGLLAPEDAPLPDQIRNSPTELARWDIYAEKSVLQMYWAAFFASGDTAYLDSIINAALRYARLNARGRQREEAFPVCASAAASLYELAPRHSVVQARIEQALKACSGPEADTLRVILRQKRPS
ncbi:translation initiation factor 2 [Desulfovibrio sp. SGI.169]|uniref:translation initiation factor 2 n=1 Tax=Desulfovibrio sp. SGI.169 TaxID=3420561 RepID=UPI003D011059